MACRAVAQCSSVSQSAASTGEDESPADRSRRISGWWGAARKINYTGDWLMGLSWCLFAGNDSLIPYFYRYRTLGCARCAMPFRPTHSMHAPFVCAGRSAQSLVGAAFTFSSCSAIVRGATTSAVKTSTATTGRSTRRQSRPSLSLGSSDGRCCLPSLPVRVPHRCCIADRWDRSTDRGPHGPHVPSDGDAEKGGSSIHRLCRSEEVGTDMPQASSGAHGLL